MEHSSFATLAGWLPAVILPLASATQLHKILRTRNVAGVSAVTWILFSVANIGAYVFTEKYLSLQAVLAFLLTAILNLVTGVLAWRWGRS